MTARTEDKDPLSDLYGVRFGGDGNSHDEENEEESITPIAGGNGHDEIAHNVMSQDDEGSEDAAATNQAGDGDGDGDAEDEDRRPASEKLLELVDNAGVIFFKDQYKVACVITPIGNHKEILRVKSGAFKRYLIRLFYNEEEQVINSEAVNSVVALLQAKAEYEGETYSLALRVAWHDSNNIYYDMTNDNWQAVKLTPEGWELVNETPVPLFQRYKQTPQVEPDRNYDGDIFDRFLQLTNLKNEEDRILLSVYIVSLFIPDIPHPISQIHGEQGAAKSTFQRLIKLLVDPAKPQLLTIYNDVKEFIQQLAHNYIAFYDNLKYTPRWLSDEACKAVTGVGSTKRELYSDDDDIVYEYRRGLGFNGINLGLTEPDILDRSIMIELQRIRRENTKQDAEVIAEFLELRPKLLGYIFDVLVKALQIKPTLKLESLPRMADFAVWGEAIARAMGYRDLEFINVYYDNIDKQNVEAVENSPLAQIIAKFVTVKQTMKTIDGTYETEERPCSWQGSMTQALEYLNQIAEENNVDTSKFWPKSPNALSRKLKPLLSNLREGLGINISMFRLPTGKKKGLHILRVLKVSQISSLPLLSSLDQFHEENGGQNSDDISGSDDIYPHQGTISSPENTQNHVQNPAGDGSDNSDDIIGTEGEDRAAQLREYDRLSLLSRKKSKDAEKVEEGEV